MTWATQFLNTMQVKTEVNFLSPINEDIVAGN